MNKHPGPSGTSKSPPEKKQLTDQDISNLCKKLLSSDDDFDLSSAKCKTLRWYKKIAIQIIHICLQYKFSYTLLKKY